MAEYDEGLYVEVTTYDLQEYTDYYANVTGEFENDKINTFTLLFPLLMVIFIVISLSMMVICELLIRSRKKGLSRPPPAYDAVMKQSTSNEIEKDPDLPSYEEALELQKTHGDLQGTYI